MHHSDHGTRNSHGAGTGGANDGGGIMALDERIQAYLTPNLWWFASTVFPLLAGTFGPMASAFSICALAVKWSTSGPSEETEQVGIPADDPVWLNAVNAPQLAIALVANIFLLLHMTRRVRFSIALPITIVGWYISSFALIALVVAINYPFGRLAPNQELGQAFYYAMFSAGLYFIMASLLVVTFFGAYEEHYDRGFNLTMSQRTMMLQTVFFLVYLLSGAAVFAQIESWTYLDAVYWGDCTLLTIGFGDYAPATVLGRALLFPYAIGGIVILGLLVNSIRSQVLDCGTVKMRARMTEKERERMLKKMQKKNSTLLKPVLERTSASTLTPGLANMRDGPSSLTEMERRRLEFELMRKVQKHVASKRKWLTLLMSACAFLGLWLGGAAIFQVTEQSQHWSYFESTYFSYTSLLTIGYGNPYPTSNAGRAFFVFWSLLAIPTLTILISKMADAIGKNLGDLTLFVSAFTFLPGNEEGRTLIKETIHKIRRKVINKVEIQQPPDNPRADSQEITSSNTESHHENEETIVADQAADFQTNIDVHGIKDEGNAYLDKAARKARTYRHYMLIKQIKNVVRHLADGGSRKYTYNEWVDYLNLIGEDESSPETHRRARRVSSTRDRAGRPTEEALKEMEKNEADPKWSWIGYRSPLIGNKETEWLLERLTGTLEREIEQMIKEESEDGPP